MVVRVLYEYPWWVPLVRYWLPLGVGLLSSLFMAFFLTGVIALPPIFGLLLWVPVLYSSLSQMTAFFALTFAMGIAGLIALSACSIFVRGVVLLPLAERLIENNQRRVQEVEKQHEEQAKNLDKMSLSLNQEAKELVEVMSKLVDKPKKEEKKKEEKEGKEKREKKKEKKEEKKKEEKKKEEKEKKQEKKAKRRNS